MHNIATLYKGCRYRSRLEAKWAAFFDLLGWDYQYEPYDLLCWIPDFTIFSADRKEEFLVDIKPYLTLDEFEKSGQINKIKGALLNDEKNGTEILLLGQSIFHNKFMGETLLGWLGEVWTVQNKSQTCNKTEYIFDDAILNNYGNKFGFFHRMGSFRDRITGKYSGNNFICFPEYNKIIELWNEAGNKVQWKLQDGRKDGKSN